MELNVHFSTDWAFDIFKNFYPNFIPRLLRMLISKGLTLIAQNFPGSFKKNLISSIAS